MRGAWSSGNQSSSRAGLAAIAARLERDGYYLRNARDLGRCEQYLRERYAEDPDARFGLVASSRDRDLESFGAPNGFQETQRVNTCVNRYRTFTLERLSDSREVDAGRTMGVDTAATGAYS